VECAQGIDIVALVYPRIRFRILQSALIEKQYMEQHIESTHNHTGVRHQLAAPPPHYCKGILALRALVRARLQGCGHSRVREERRQRIPIKNRRRVVRGSARHWPDPVLPVSRSCMSPSHPCTPRQTPTHAPSVCANTREHTHTHIHSRRIRWCKANVVVVEHSNTHTYTPSHAAWH
jgi:hypothetical protein